MQAYRDGSKPRALLVTNLRKDDAERVAADAVMHFISLGWEVDNFSFPGAPGVPPTFDCADLVVSIGGDGTLLYTARCAAPCSVPVLPINLGRLGFIAANRRESWKDVLRRWIEGELPVSSRMMLRIEVRSKGATGGAFLCLNDGVISAQGISKLIGLRLAAGGRVFGEYRADGLIVSTPTGSTAYNLAAGGPAVHPELRAIIANPICAFTLASRPLVLPGDEILDVTIEETRRSGALLTIDGQETLSLEAGDTVSFAQSDRTVSLVVPPELVFYGSLQAKLGWTGDRDA